MPEHPSPDDALQSLLVRTMVLVCVRNSKIEDIHAGLTPVTKTGDYSDVTVIDADGRRIAWPDVSHIDDEQMRDLMRQVVDRLHTFYGALRRTEFSRQDRSVDRRREPLGRAEAGRVVPARTYRGHHSAMTETVVDGPGPRHAFALHPDPVGAFSTASTSSSRTPTAESGRPAPT